MTDTAASPAGAGHDATSLEGATNRDLKMTAAMAEESSPAASVRRRRPSAAGHLARGARGRHVVLWAFSTRSLLFLKDKCHGVSIKDTFC